MVNPSRFEIQQRNMLLLMTMIEWGRGYQEISLVRALSSFLLELKVFLDTPRYT